MVQELDGVAVLAVAQVEVERLGVQAQHQQLIARERHAIAVERVEEAVAVEVERDVAVERVEQRLLALEIGDVGAAVKVGIERGQAKRPLAARQAVGVGRDIPLRVHQLAGPLADGEDEGAATGPRVDGERLGPTIRAQVLVANQAVGVLLHDGRIVDIGRGQVAGGILILIQVVRLIPVPTPDLLGDVEAATRGEEAAVEARALVLVEGVQLGHDSRVPRDAIVARGLGVLGIEGALNVAVGLVFDIARRDGRRRLVNHLLLLLQFPVLLLERRACGGREEGARDDGIVTRALGEVAKGTNGKT